VSPSTSTTYLVTITDPNNGCFETTQFDIFVDPAPKLFLLEDVICRITDKNPFVIRGVTAEGIDVSSIEWSQLPGDQKILGFTSDPLVPTYDFIDFGAGFGQLRLTANGLGACENQGLDEIVSFRQSRDLLDIEIHPLEAAVCAGDSIELTIVVNQISSSNPALFIDSVVWSATPPVWTTDMTGLSIFMKPTGSDGHMEVYHALIRRSDGCWTEYFDASTITISYRPTIADFSDIDFCEEHGQPVAIQRPGSVTDDHKIFIHAEIDDAGSETEVMWGLGGGFNPFMFTPTESQQIYIRFESAIAPQCNIIDTIEVIIHRTPEFTRIQDTVMCYPSELLIFIEFEEEDPNRKIEWVDAMTGETLSTETEFTHYFSETSFVTERLGFLYTFLPQLHFVYKVREFRCVQSRLQVIGTRVTSDQL
jgi:hypothetical protein